MVLSPFDKFDDKKRKSWKFRLGYSNYRFISCYSKASYDAMKK